MIRVIGAICIILGATGVGAGKAYSYYRQVRQMSDLYRAMELLQCELNYTMYSIPKLLHMTADQIKGVCGMYFRNLAEQIDAGTPREKAARYALEQTNGICLPKDGVFALLDFSSSLGNFDLEGENRMIKLSHERVKTALRRLEDEKKGLAKSYTVLGASMGIALAILML